MDTNLYWKLEGQVVSCDVSGTLSAEDVADCAQQIADFVEQGDHPLVHVLMNLNQMTELPMNIGVMSKASAPILSRHNLGWFIIHGMEDRKLRFIVTLLMQVFRTRFRSFQSEAEACAFLQEVDQTLPELAPAL